MSYQRILVPLDGSRLAEAVLPAACSLAKRLPAQLVLLHVLEEQPPARVHGEPHLCSADEARAFLEALAQRLAGHGLEVEVDVHERPVDDVAAAIDQHVHELRIDLIAMCAHGRSNLRTRLVGSIAERILRGGSVPILLRTVREPDGAGFDLRTVLVPIDFGHDVDAALDGAEALATPYGAGIVLLSALEPPPAPASRLLPATSALAGEQDREALGRRLAALAEDLRSRDRDVRAIISERSPAEAILAAAETLPADLIVLTTEGRGGLSTLYDPSTVRQLLDRPELTLLLIKEL